MKAVVAIAALLAVVYLSFRVVEYVTAIEAAHLVTMDAN